MLIRRPRSVRSASRSVPISRASLCLRNISVRFSSSAVEGYLDESYVIEAAELAGFTLMESSELNANPADTKNYPKGVYALPPTLAMGNYNKAEYLKIGESDRMTLKFIKPEQ